MQLGRQIKEQESNPNKSYFDKVSIAESGGNSNAKNPYSSAGGKYQFIDSTWKSVVEKYNLGYSLQDKYNPVKAQVVMEYFTKDNKEQLEKSIGYQPNDGDLYLAHFLGAGGASKFIKTVNTEPNKLTTEHFSEGELKANRNVFFNKDGSPKTVSQVYNSMTSKVMSDENTSQPQTTVSYSTFTEKPNMQGINLSNAPEEEKSEELKQIEKADKNLELEERKQKLFEQFNKREPQEQEVVQQQTQAPDFNVLQTYQEIDQFVSNPIMQSGGVVNDNLVNTAKRDYSKDLEYERKRRVKSQQALQDFLSGKTSYVESPTLTQDKRTYEQRQQSQLRAKKATESLERKGGQEVVDKSKRIEYQVGDFVREVVSAPQKTMVYGMTGEYTQPSTILRRSYPNMTPIEATIADVFLDPLLFFGGFKSGVGLKGNKYVTNADNILNKFLKYLQHYDNTLDGFENFYFKKRGGQIPSTPLGQYEYPNQIVNVPTNGSITMQGVNYPLMGISQETGERKIMFPNQEYFFRNTQNVVEVPLDFLRPI